MVFQLSLKCFLTEPNMVFNKMISLYKLLVIYLNLLTVIFPWGEPHVPSFADPLHSGSHSETDPALGSVGLVCGLEIERVDLT